LPQGAHSRKLCTIWWLGGKCECYFPRMAEVSKLGDRALLVSVDREHWVFVSLEKGGYVRVGFSGVCTLVCVSRMCLGTGAVSGVWGVTVLGSCNWGVLPPPHPHTQPCQDREEGRACGGTGGRAVRLCV
jgi:hypothetical protein